MRIWHRHIHILTSRLHRTTSRHTGRTPRINRNNAFLGAFVVLTRQLIRLISTRAVERIKSTRYIESFFTHARNIQRLGFFSKRDHRTGKRGVLADRTTKGVHELTASAFLSREDITSTLHDRIKFGRSRRGRSRRRGRHGRGLCNGSRERRTVSLHRLTRHCRNRKFPHRRRRYVLVDSSGEFKISILQ